MELKVNIDKSTQQIMCSINETTTIQDMIVALAQALQQTGKFYLTEKSDFDERIVSSNEKPYDLHQYYSSMPFKIELFLKKLDDAADDVFLEEDACKTSTECVESFVQNKSLNSLAHADLFDLISIQQSRLNYQSQRLDDLHQELSKYDDTSSTSSDSLVEKSEEFLHTLNDQQNKLKAKISEFKLQLKISQTFLKFVQSHIEYLDIIHEKTKETIQYEQVLCFILYTTSKMYQFIT
jgi:hypothetical protein